MLILSSIVWIQPKFITFYQRIHQTYTRVAADSVSRKTMLIAGLPAWRFSPTTSAGHCLTIESYWPQDIAWQFNPITIVEHCLQFSPVRRTLLDNSVLLTAGHYLTTQSEYDRRTLLTIQSRPQDIAWQFSPTTSAWHCLTIQSYYVRRTLLDNSVPSAEHCLTIQSYYDPLI